mgnify:CR=1 FL=1
MIRTADRMGHITEEDSFQNNLLEKIYGSVAGRMLIRPLVTPVVSIAMGWILDSRLSAALHNCPVPKATEKIYTVQSSGYE